MFVKIDIQHIMKARLALLEAKTMAECKVIDYKRLDLQGCVMLAQGSVAEINAALDSLKEFEVVV